MRQLVLHVRPGYLCTKSAISVVETLSVEVLTGIDFVENYVNGN